MECCVWIVGQTEYEQGLFEALPHTVYILVDADYQPLLDGEGKQYRCDTMAEAEKKIREVLKPRIEKMLEELEDGDYV